jgi:cytochrome bd ubiquinol oxidase subunit II
MILFWCAALVLVLLLYVVLDGFDLGVGILFSMARDETERRQMLAAIAPVWDGNETWLVLTAAILFGAFPRVYATLLQAFYLPMILLLAALIFRGVAFEFREQSLRLRTLWDIGFAAGSILAAFIQGMTVGALVLGVPLVDGRYAGTAFSWFSPFSVLCGFGLCVGYALLGASWLVAKTTDALRTRAYGYQRVLLATAVAILGLAFLFALSKHLFILERWQKHPGLLLCPALGAVGVGIIWRGLRAQRDTYAFRGCLILFLAAFGTLAICLWPYMLPFSVTIEQAAAPPASLHFMFWGAGILVLPLTLLYTTFVYRTFGGKIDVGSEPWSSDGRPIPKAPRRSTS